MKQTEKVLLYMTNHGWITQATAWDKFRISRLAAVINRIKKEGWVIETKLIPFRSADGARSVFAAYKIKNAALDAGTIENGEDTL